MTQLQYFGLMSMLTLIAANTAPDWLCRYLYPGAFFMLGVTFIGEILR